jgi:hypothetical protein
MLRVLNSTRLVWTRHVEDGVLTLRAPLPTRGSGVDPAGQPAAPAASGPIR